MNAIQLKNDFHKLIDNYDNIDVLESSFEYLQSHQKARKLSDELTPEQYTEFKESLEQVKQGNTIPHDEVMAHLRGLVSK